MKTKLICLLFVTNVDIPLQEAGDCDLSDPFDAPDTFSVFVGQNYITLFVYLIVHSCVTFVFVSNYIRIHFKNDTNKPNIKKHIIG